LRLLQAAELLSASRMRDLRDETEQLETEQLIKILSTILSAKQKTKN
jgi:hypothetical protein